MNRIHSRTERKLARALRPQRPWWTMPVAFLATLLALPVNAGITIPDDPLTTGNRVAPNILFILDDSGSMAWGNMNSQDISKITGSGSFSDGPDANGIGTGTSKTTESTGNSAMYEQNYVTNTLYYNPGTSYKPWMQAGGTRMTGGMSFTSVYSDNNGTSGSKNLSSNTQTFYAPKVPATSTISYLSKVDNYYRYQFTGGDLVRGEWGQVVETSQTAPGFPNNSHSASKRNWDVLSLTVPSGLASFTVTTSGGSGNSNLYVDFSNPPSSPYSCSSTSGNTADSCSVYSPSAGTYYIGLYGSSSFSNVNVTVKFTTSNSCDGDSAGSWGWINCTVSTAAGSATPTGRTVAAEQANFATWYSYYRTRIKAAKGGAAEAFSPLGNKVRVGYRSLHENGSSDFDIPVASGDGRFIDDSSASITNRSTWYNRLFNASANNGTPLQSILNAAGTYFSGSGSSGPYGPESGSDQLSCRQNFTILTTDGYWNGGTAGSGNVDNTAGTTIKGPKSKSYKYSPVSPYKDGNDSTLADVAMKYWVTDLRTESYMGNSTSPNNNNVPTTDDDPAFWQHMVTFSISIGLKTTQGWSSVEDVTANPTWNDPSGNPPGNDQPANIDDLLHAAVNGHGQFVAATSPDAFTAGLRKALAAIAKRTSSYSNVATNSTSLSTGAQVFSASYVSGDWVGAVKAQSVDRNGVSATASWTATIPGVGTRKVYTSSGTVGSPGSSGATFPTSSQTTALERTGGPSNYPVTGADNAAYIKGNATLEDRNGGLLRDRPTTVLGDIIGSSPAYVEGGADGDGTAAGTLYVGANDGMLHAFDAANGNELFAYVPNILNFGNLASLSRGDYDHKFFVDGPIAISPHALTAGQNILVGTLGRGGKGLYALDVSAPGSFNTGSFKWEKNETSGSNMGLVLGAPVLANVRNGAGTPAVVFGNGPNSVNDKAVLVVLDLDTGAVIREIDTGVGSSSAPNGLFAPLGLYAADGKTLVYAYAADMQGNLWKFDLRSSTPSAWTATKLFHAEKTAGTPQPITGGLASAIDPRTGKRWVFFGTGRFLTTSDGNDKTTFAQSIYGVMDDGVTYTRSDLTSHAVTLDGASGNRYFDDKATLPSASKGWYVDLPGKGERVVQDAQVDGDFVVTASMIPEGDACEASGTGFINAIDAFTGTNGGKSYFDLDRDGNTDNTGTGGKPTGSVNLGVGMPTRPVLLPGVGVVDGSAGLGANSFGKQIMSWQRVSWREIRKD